MTATGFEPTTTQFVNEHITIYPKWFSFYLQTKGFWIQIPLLPRNIDISKYSLLAGSSYIKLLKELDHPRKSLINIQNIGNNDCFKLYLDA